MKHRRLLQPTRCIASYRRDHTILFSRWLGRRLNSSERIIINTFEAARLRGRTVRAQINHTRHFNPTSLILEYANFLQHNSPNHDIALLAPTKKLAKFYRKGLNRRPLITASNRTADALRGSTFEIAVAFNVKKPAITKIIYAALPVIPEQRRNAAFIVTSEIDNAANLYPLLLSGLDPPPCKLLRKFAMTTITINDSVGAECVSTYARPVTNIENTATAVLV